VLYLAVCYGNLGLVVTQSSYKDMFVIQKPDVNDLEPTIISGATQTRHNIFSFMKEEEFVDYLKSFQIL
jgi:hypothetical protein